MRTISCARIAVIGIALLMVTPLARAENSVPDERDKRIEVLEYKLDELAKQVQALKKELAAERAAAAEDRASLSQITAVPKSRTSATRSFLMRNRGSANSLWVGMENFTPTFRKAHLATSSTFIALFFPWGTISMIGSSSGLRQRSNMHLSPMIVMASY